MVLLSECKRGVDILLNQMHFSCIKAMVALNWTKLVKHSKLPVFELEDSMFCTLILGKKITMCSFNSLNDSCKTDGSVCVAVSNLVSYPGDQVWHTGISNSMKVLCTRGTSAM